MTEGQAIWPPVPKLNFMNYSFYLFSQLFDVYHTTDATYDEKFKEISAMYQDYLKSGYNNPNYGEYECISAYLSEHLPSI